MKALRTAPALTTPEGEVVTPQTNFRAWLKAYDALRAARAAERLAARQEQTR